MTLQFPECTIQTPVTALYQPKETFPEISKDFLLFFPMGASLGFINYFSRTFGFGGGLIPLHLSVVAGLFMAGMLCAGFLLLIRSTGGRAGRGLNGIISSPAGLIPAAGFVVLTAL